MQRTRLHSTASSQDSDQRDVVNASHAVTAALLGLQVQPIKPHCTDACAGASAEAYHLAAQNSAGVQPPAQYLNMTGATASSAAGRVASSFTITLTGAMAASVSGQCASHQNLLGRHADVAAAVAAAAAAAAMARFFFSRQ